MKLSLRLSQSKPLYEAFKGIKDGKLWSQLSEAQQRIVDGELRDFVLGGVALEVRHRMPSPVESTGSPKITCNAHLQPMTLHLSCITAALGEGHL